ncbi:MAG: hypothetical protein IJ122_06310 [Methanobrevibacter sp.]|nr:hypothetical protein [Methanobrevibacter sp.]
MATLSKNSREKLKCICEICEHDCLHKTCLFNKIVDSKNPGQKMYQELEKIILEEAKHVNQRQSKKSKSK